MLRAQVVYYEEVKSISKRKSKVKVHVASHFDEGARRRTGCLFVETRFSARKPFI